MFDWASRITERAATCGIALPSDLTESLAGHARRVLEASARLGLTTITDESEFLERHLGEAFEGAALLDPRARGVLLDVGSGNGYPGIPLACAREGLEAVLAESNARRAAFLEEVLAQCGLRGRVLRRHVERPRDLAELPPLRVLATRATSDWSRILPRLARRLAPEGEVLVWAGEAMEPIRSRASWRRLALVERKALPGRERSWIWRFVAR